jgi:hypothetical protein
MALVLKDFFNIFPDGILFGSFTISLLTLSPVHTTFFFSLVEGLFFLYGFQQITSFLVGSTFGPPKCKPSLYHSTFQDLLLTYSENNPSYAVYIVSFACSYIAYSLFKVQNELDVLEDSTYKQYQISFVILITLAIVYCLFRMWFSCDSISASLTALFLGGATALLLVTQNTNIFGKDIINFLGIPLLRNISVNNQPIYICSK